ncbi:hypothetical protein Tco_0282003 [Tanacetum coccineum]
MTGNRKLFSTYKAYNGGNVIFGIVNLRWFNTHWQGQICDNKCRVTFSEHDSEITKDGKVIDPGGLIVVCKFRLVKSVCLREYPYRISWYQSEGVSVAMTGDKNVMARGNLEAATKCKETIIKHCPNATTDIMQLDVSALDTVRNFSKLQVEKMMRSHGWHLEEIHMTWAHFGKKQTRLQLYTKVDEEQPYSG